MANNILLKKSSVASKVPTTSDLDYGELALNYADGALYYKTAGNAIARLNPLEADTLATVTGRGATTSTAITLSGDPGVSIAANSSIGRILFSKTGATTQIWQLGTSGNDATARGFNIDDYTAGATRFRIAHTTGDISLNASTFTSGIAYITNTTGSTATNNGALVVSGGLGVAGQIYAGGINVVSGGNVVGKLQSSSPAGGVLQLSSANAASTIFSIVTTDYANTIAIGYNTPILIGMYGGTNIQNTTASTSTSTGALVVGGGAGIGGALYVGSNLSVNGASSLAGDVTNVDSITFDLTAAEATGIGKLYWDAGFGELRYGLGGGNVDLAIGQMQVTYCRNAETSTITKGQVVYLFGAQGDRPSVKLASNTSDTTSAKTFGIAAENIPAAADGYVINVGTVTGVDTSMYSPGDILWLGSTAGTVTTTKAVAPNHLVFIGVVQKVNQSAGQIYVKVQNGYELDEIHDVLITSVGLNHSLFYDTSVNVWKNYAPSAARTNLGLGTIATQNANNVSITGGAIDGTPIGATTPSTGKFTTLQTTGNVTVGGNLTVSGTTTTVNAQNLSIADNLIYLNEGSTNSNPDLGFAGNYNDGVYRHGGFFRDATDGYWKVFKNYTPEPDASIYIDTSHASFALADIQAANFRGALVGNATTASTLAGTPTINGVTFNGGSNITITSNTTNALTIGDGLSGTSFNGSAAVTIAVDSTVARRSDVTYIGTTSIALNRTSAAQSLTGINAVTAGTTTDLVLTGGSTGTSITVGQGSSGRVTVTPITASASALRLLRASGADQQWLDLSGGDPGGIYIVGRSVSGAEKPLIYDVVTSSGTLNSSNYHSWRLGGGEYMRLSDTGNLGINTTNPSYKLHVNVASTGVGARFNNGGNYLDIGGFSSGTTYIRGWENIVQFGNSYNGHTTFITNNTERMRIDNSGNVGIGTTSPSELLDIAASADNSSVAGPKINLKKGSTNKAAIGIGGNYLGQATNTDDLIFRNDAGNILFGFSGAEKMRITSGGDVGIGTNSPTAKLDVYGGASATPQTYILARAGSFTAALGAQDSAGVGQEAFVGSLSNCDFKFKANSTEYMRLTSTGNLGVGITSPAVKLDVNGDIAIPAGSKLFLRGSGDANWYFTQVESTHNIVINGFSDASRAFQIRDSANSNAVRFNVDLGTGSSYINGGNFGIATTTPSYKFQVNSGADEYAIAWSRNSTKVWAIGTDSLGTYINNRTDNVLPIYIKNGGDVGIGTTTPGAKLDVNGDIHANGTNGVVLYNADPANYNISRSGGDLIFKGGAIVTVRAGGTGANNAEIVYSNLPALYFKTANSTRMTIDSGGSVGIGVSPSYTLDVAGGFRTDRSSTGTVARLQASGITAGQQANLFLGKSDTNNNEATFVWHHVGDGSTSNYLGIGVYGTDDVLNVFAGNRVGVATTASVGNTTLTVSTGIAAYTNTAGVAPYLQTYNGNATLNEKTWRMGGQANGKFQIETVNDAYSAASTKVIISQTGNVGIGVDPTEKLHVAGAARITGILYDSAYNAGTNGQVLTSTGTGTAWSSTGVAVSGNGNTNYVAKWSSSTGLTDSGIYETADGKVSIGAGTSPSQKLEISGNFGWGSEHVLSYSALTTNSTTANQVITSVSTTTYRTFKFIIQATDATAGKYQSQEILAVHNGSTVAHTEYTAINVGGAVATYDVDISGSTVRLLCTPLSANSTVFKVSMQLIKV